MNKTWSDERTERLKKMWADGWSASQCAAELGCTRNAVIGRLHRVGAPGRVKPREAAPQQPRQSRFNPSISPKNRTKTAPAKPMEAPMMKSLKPVHILERNMLTQCAWPLWDDSRSAWSELMCCGNPVAKGEKSYCEGHAYMSSGSYRAQREAA